MQVHEPVPHATNEHDAEYTAYMSRLQERFLSVVNNGTEPLFHTDAEDLFGVYLQAFAVGVERQYHDCHACRLFINRFGGLVTIAADGTTASAIWDEADAPDVYRAAIAALARAVRRAKVVGVFLSSEPTWGMPLAGGWHHFAVVPPNTMVYRRATQTAGQAMAEKRQDFTTVMHALNEFTQPMIEQALTLLRTDSLYRSEKVLGPAQFLYDLHVARTAAHGSNRANVVWRAIANAPAGFCHPRSSMVGTLLEDIAAGLDFGDVSRRFAAKMHPLQYQRPSADPSAGVIAQAEKVMAQLGAAGALARRYARLDEIEAIWRQGADASMPAEGGVFAHLKPKAAEPAKSIAPPAVMTWEKFARTVLPNANRLQVMVPNHGNFTGTATAVNADAPPIIQWDSEDRRNPFSWYVYDGGSAASQWGLKPGWCNAPAVMLRPHMWHGAKFPHQGVGAVFVLEGARDTREAHACLFPETMKSEFHGIRSVIEAHSRATVMQGRDEASANGIDVIGATVRVTPHKGPLTDYRIDRWD